MSNTVYVISPVARNDGQSGEALSDQFGNSKVVLASGAGLIASGSTVPSSTVVSSSINTLPLTIYRAAPTAKTEGQGGPFHSEPSGSLLTNGTWVAGGSIADLSTAYQVCTLTTGTGLDAVPDRCVFGLLEISMAVGDGTSLSFTVKLTRDLAGDILLLGPTTVGVEPGQTTAATKGATLDLNRIPYKRGDIGTSGSIYAWVLCNAVPAGTQVTTVRLHGEYR